MKKEKFLKFQFVKGEKIFPFRAEKKDFFKGVSHKPPSKSFKYSTPEQELASIFIDKAGVLFDKSQQDLLFFLEKIGKIKTGKESERNNSSFYFLPTENFTGRKAILWLYKYVTYQVNALSTISDFIGGEIEKFACFSYFHKKGEFSPIGQSDSRFVGMKRGKFEMHGVNCRPTVILEIYNGESWERL